MFENYNEAFRLIKLYPELVRGRITPCSEEVIRKAETLLEVKFPYTYHLFLRCFGDLDFGGSSIMGIFENDLEKSRTIGYTLEERNNPYVEKPMPQNFVVIEHEGLDGELVCLKINERSPDESPVVSYFDYAESSPILAPNFETFFLDWVKQKIEFYHEEHPYIPRKVLQPIRKKPPEKPLIQGELF